MATKKTKSGKPIKGGTYVAKGTGASKAYVPVRTIAGALRKAANAVKKTGDKAGNTARAKKIGDSLSGGGSSSKSSSSSGSSSGGGSYSRGGSKRYSGSRRRSSGKKSSSGKKKDENKGSSGGGVKVGKFKYDTSYYDQSKKAYKKQATKMAKSQIASTNANYDAQLKAAYAANQRNQMALQNTMAAQGIRGGASETAMLGLATDYQNTRNTTNASRNAEISKINSELQSNIFNYNQAVDDQKNAYLQNRMDTDKQAAYNAYASTFYDVNKLKKAAKKTKDAMKRSAYNTRIGYLNAHKKGY